MQRMAGRSTGPKFSSDLNQRNIRSRERIHFDMPFIEEEVDWYGRGAAGVLGIGATHRGFVQPVTQHTGSYVPPMSARGVSRKCFLAIMVALVLVLAFVWGWLMSMMGTRWFVGYFPANPLPYLDCCVTVLILTAQTLSAMKKWDCWIAWLFVNVANLTLYLKAGLVFMPIVSCLYLINGIWSLFTWYRLYKTNK